jgi:GTP-binding protein HflX
MTAFRATLEEVLEAALIVHVSDVSNPHHTELDAEVDKILADLGVQDRPRLRVFNKIDLLTEEQRAPLAHPYAMGAGSDGGPVLVSALTGQGLDELLGRIDAALPVDPVVRLELRLPLADGRTLALVHALGRVLHSAVEDSYMRLEAELPVSVARRLRLDGHRSKSGGTLPPSSA